MSRFFIVILLLTLAARTAFAEIDDWMPNAHHAEIVSQGRDCAIYRSLATKARLTLEQTEDAELHFSELLKVRRADLLKCAEIRGVDMDGSLESEEAAAESCNDTYEKWVRTGYRLRVVLQDRDSAQRALDLLGVNLDRYCARPTDLSSASLRVR